METQQTKCFYCYKELALTDEKRWVENDGTCPNCATSLTTDDVTCWNCDKPAIQEDLILYCATCINLVADMSDNDEKL